MVICVLPAGVSRSALSAAYLCALWGSASMTGLQNVANVLSASRGSRHLRRRYETSILLSVLSILSCGAFTPTCRERFGSSDGLSRDELGNELRTELFCELN